MVRRAWRNTRTLLRRTTLAPNWAGGLVLAGRAARGRERSALSPWRRSANETYLPGGVAPGPSPVALSQVRPPAAVVATSPRLLSSFPGTLAPPLRPLAFARQALEHVPWRGY